MSLGHAKMTMKLDVAIYESIERAPKYPNHVFLETIRAHVVKNGTVQGQPTVDLEFKDADGNVYTAIYPSSIIRALAGIMEQLDGDSDLRNIRVVN
jgi:hypothetical protein